TDQTSWVDMRAPWIHCRYRVPCCVYDEESRLTPEKRISTHQERIGAFCNQCGEPRFEFALVRGVQNKEPLTESARRMLHVRQLRLGLRIAGIEQIGYEASGRHKLVQQFQPLHLDLHAHTSNAGDVSSGPIEAGDEAEPNRIGEHVENNRGRRCRSL